MVGTRAATFRILMVKAWSNAHRRLGTQASGALNAMI
jgi:hypothetical protein